VRAVRAPRTRGMPACRSMPRGAAASRARRSRGPPSTRLRARVPGRVFPRPVRAFPRPVSIRVGKEGPARALGRRLKGAHPLSALADAGALPRPSGLRCKRIHGLGVIRSRGHGATRTAEGGPPVCEKGTASRCRRGNARIVRGATRNRAAASVRRASRTSPPLFRPAAPRRRRVDTSHGAATGWARQ
jgi:hypothetical protein